VAYSDKFNEEVKLDILNEGQEFIVRMFMKNGELIFRERLIASLEETINEYLSEVRDEPNEEWVDGVRYVIHLIKDGDFDGGE